MTKRSLIFTIALVLTLSLCLGMFAACNGGDDLPEFGETTDNYRTFYQIFPISFADSDGDGNGDLQGIVDKLSYIDNMNFDGIWLTPVHQAKTYHKYDVEDYKSIDKTLGTLEDYDKLVTECHLRGMSVILDLVINHSSNQNQWFKNACRARIGDRTDDPYYNYYNFSQTQGPGYYPVDNHSGWYYEGSFGTTMPDINWSEVLANPDGPLAKDIEGVMRFWLIDHNVDGFRLDAVGEYFSGDDAKNIQCLEWIDKTAKAIKPDCYIVGEGPWGANAYKYHSSGVDSLFLFTHGFRGDNSISMAGRGMTGAFSWFSGIDATDKRQVGVYEGSIPALFVANHDTSRAYGILQGGTSVDNMKMGYAVMAMSAGTTFWYYGDELGLTAYTNSSGGIRDENRRQPLPWGDDYTCKPVHGSDPADDSVKYPFGTAKQNLKDKDSLLNFITRANAVRRAFPAIARNYGVVVYDDNDCVGIVQKGEGADAVYIAVNLSHIADATIDLSTLGNFEIAATLSVGAEPTLNGNSLQMPSMTFAVLKKI